MAYNSVLDAVGNTPLIRMSRVLADAPFETYAKFEGLNPGGSIKDRPARLIIQEALETGDVGAGTVVVESSSGNMGIGLAQACRYYGLRFICVVDPNATAQNLRILQAYGAEVSRVDSPDLATGEWLPARLTRVRELLDAHPKSFWPNQYSNLGNPRSHALTTMAEIDAALSGRVDVLFCATSTCGVLRGCIDYIRAHDLPTMVYAVDAVGSMIFGTEKAKRLIPGMGAGRKPELFRDDLADAVVQVSDIECVAGCRRLLHDEALFAGGSSGGILSAILRSRDAIPSGATCVAVLPDRGERYLDTVYCDAWVEAHLGALPTWALGSPSGSTRTAVPLPTDPPPQETLSAPISRPNASRAVA